MASAAVSYSTTLPLSALPCPSGNGPIVLSEVRWQTYEDLLCDLADRHIRLTYDRGYLEIIWGQGGEFT